MSDYPLYFILDERPVKLVLDEQGTMTALAYNWKNGELAKDWDAYFRVYKLGSGAKKVSETEFEQQVALLRSQIKQ